MAFPSAIGSMTMGLEDRVARNPSPMLPRRSARASASETTVVCSSSAGFSATPRLRSSSVPRSTLIAPNLDQEQSTCLQWPLPAPGAQEPEGFSASTRVEAAGSMLRGPTHAEGPDARAGRSPQRVGYEIRVNPARAANFTTEKARLLRQKMRELDSHHDVMYHSGLASRLA